MIDVKRAVIFVDDEGEDEGSAGKPLLFQQVLFCPMLTWLSDELRSRGVERFFVLCDQKYQQQALSCFSEKTNVTVSDQ